jgi:hypothetical protein
LGIFDVFMPLIYSEGENAFDRLKEEIYRRSRNRLEETMMKLLEDLKITNLEEDIKRIELSKNPLLKDYYK